MASSSKEAPVQDALPPFAYNVREAAKTLSLSESKVYQLIASGELYHRRVGKRILVPRKALDAFMEGRPYERGGME
ncbi:MAG TPA: helix-turn-helix domain-containing protein [Candidatus Limnocylindria bacterium]|nr:helix-turn-helix domain-containing protein [Candidatus Limnocylindria bacterium]